MADTTTDDPSQHDTTQTTTTGNDDGKTVPLSALQAERDKAKAIKAELDAIKAAQEAKAREAAEKAGEWERLYREAEPKLARLTEVEAKLTAVEQREAQAREARRLKLPDHLRATIPDGLDAERLDFMLDKLEAVAASVTGKTGDDTARSKGTGHDANTLSDAEKAWVESNPWAQGASVEVIRRAYRKMNPPPPK